MNFIQLTSTKSCSKNHTKKTTKRLINEMNITNLKNALRNTDWLSIYNDQDVDSSFEKFWSLFHALYNEHFPITSIKFNRNKHKINGFMTEELLSARRIKLNLHRTARSTKSQADHDQYVAYRNYYNALLRQSKQKYYTDNFNLNVKNAKRSWELLKEAANLTKSHSNVEKI
jgi:hypothetical protein